MSYYIKRGTQITISSEKDQQINTDLPVGTYAVKFNPQGGFFYLTEIDDMSLPTKTYGKSNQENTDRILKKFASQTKSVGVLLEGLKGTGKTMLTKTLSATLREQGISTIVVSDAFNGTEFNTFMGQIDVPAMVMFDEFEKVYHDQDAQAALLSLFDGVMESKKLFVLTVNGRVNEFLINRPGRMHYRIKFRGLEKDFVSEFLDETLVNQDHRVDLEQLLDCFAELSFDMLKAVVDEMNLFGFTAKEATKNLNVDLMDAKIRYAVTVLIDGKPAKSIYPFVYEGLPFTNGDRLNVAVYTDHANKDAFKDNDLFFSKEDLVSIKDGGIISLRKTHEKKDVVLILEKQKPFSFDTWAF